MGISKAGSLKGWNFKVWAKRNSDNLKALVLLLFGYNYFAGFEWKVFILAVLVIAGKLLVDTIDFWLSDVELPK